MGDLPVVEEVTHDLYVIYWNEPNQLLYVNSFNNGTTHEALADAACRGAQLLRGEQVYRVLVDIDRPSLPMSAYWT